MDIVLNAKFAIDNGIFRTVKREMSILVAFTVAACGADTGTRLGEPKAERVDVLYTNGVIWTGPEGVEDAAVLAIKDGVVAYVGDGENIGIWGERTTLSGRADV